MQKINEAFGTSIDWIESGKGEMLFNLPQPKSELGSNPWRDEAYSMLQKQNEFLQKQVDQLMSLMNSITGKLGKLKASDKSALLLKLPVLPDNVSEVRAAV